MALISPGCKHVVSSGVGPYVKGGDILGGKALSILRARSRCSGNAMTVPQNNLSRMLGAGSVVPSQHSRSKSHVIGSNSIETIAGFQKKTYGTLKATVAAQNTVNPIRRVVERINV